MRPNDHKKRRPKKPSSVLSALFIFLGLFSYGIDSRAEDGSFPDVTIKEVTNLGVIETTPLIKGRDGGYSALFEGRSVWIYGDTLLAKKNRRGRKYHSSSWSSTTDLDAGDGIGNFEEYNDSAGVPYELFPLTAEEKEFNDDHMSDNCKKEPCGARWALWPGAIIADPQRDRMLVFYEKVYVKRGVLNFQRVGHSLAIWKNMQGSPKRLIFRTGKKHPTIMFKENEPGFGDAAIAVGSMLYVFGCDPDGHSKPCRLARVPLKNALDRNAWEFYCGDGTWQGQISRSKALFHGNDIMSVSYNPYLERFLAVYSQPMGTGVFFRTSMNIEGPWSKQVKAFNARAPVNRIGWIYDAIEHPEYARDGGRVIYITYSRQTGPLSFDLMLVKVRIGKP